MSRAQLPNVVLVGRTNVGKSTLFNRLTEQESALTSKIAGTTRDRKEGECIWRGRIFTVVDTGGLDVDFSNEIEHNIVKQAKLAMKRADLILFVVDLTQDPLPQDIELAKRLSSGNKPVIVVGNKAESQQTMHKSQSPDWQLGGLSAPMPISSTRGSGVGDLLDEVYEQLTTIGKEPLLPSQVHAVRVSLIGKPNVGKSSLVNAIVGEERFIVSPIAHTTREPIDTLVEMEDKSYILIDTAGMRKKGKVRKSGGLEAAGVEKTEKILKETDIALFVLDVTRRIGKQEKHLAGKLADQDIGVVIIANKWDLIPGKTPYTINEERDRIRSALPFMRWAPILFVSAKTHKRVGKIFEVIDQVQSNRLRQLHEKELRAFWKQAVRQHKPSRHKGPKHPTILDMQQVGIKPPTFQITLKAKQTDVLHPSYLRYLENRLRENFPLDGTPIRMKLRGLEDV